MLEKLADWPAIDVVFLLCAVLGGTAFLIWVILQFLGADLDTDVDMDVDVDTDFDASDTSGTADISFTLLSFQGLAAFLTMFGLVGLGVHRDVGLGGFLSLGAAGAAGFGLTWVISRLFAAFNRLQSSGTIKMESAIGQEGSIYLTVPESGEGKVQLTVQGRFQVLPAVSEGGERIETGARVMVIGVSDDRTLVVTKA